MRSRPHVELTLAPGVIYPGTTFVADLHVDAATETPCDFVELSLIGYEQMFTGAGNTRHATQHRIVRLRVRHEPTLLVPGRRTFSGSFPVPPHAPAAFHGAECSVHYSCKVHISIPWWPDRRESYVVPVRWAPRKVGDPVVQTFATNTAGPTGGAAYMEASLDRTEVVAGETVGGSFSLANVGGHKIRSVRATILGIEHRKGRNVADLLATRLGGEIHEGDVREGEPVRFRLAVPAHVAPTFEASLFKVDYHLELRADVAWGSDVLLRIPIVIHPKDSNAGKRAPEGRIAPVGRERRAVVWADVAARLGLENDVEQERMRFRDGDVSLVVQLEPRDGEMFVSAILAWPSLGIDLVGRRGWTTLFTGDHRLTVRAREAAQADALLGAGLRDELGELDDAHIDDHGARLAQRGNAQVGDRLFPIVARYKAIACEIAAALPRLPPPAAMAAHLPAWEAFAARVHGRLERGSMWIRGTSGTDAVEVGTLWGPKGEIAGTRVAVVLEPPMDVDLEAATTSPAARGELRDLAASVTTHHTPGALAVLLPEPLADPSAAEPWLERLRRAARALRGQTGAGPFR